MTPTLRTAVVLLSLAGLSSCIKDKDAVEGDSVDPSACTLPTVNGGADQSVTLASRVIVAAEGTVCATGEEPSFSWTVESAPVESAVDTGDLDLTNPAEVSFAPDVVGTYVLTVTASDSTGASSVPDYVVITVTSGNAAPIADCGPNVTASVDERVALDGSASSDPEGAELTYAWTLSSVPTCSALDGADVYNASTVAASVVPDCPGVFVVGLAVNDGSNWSSADFCSITVESTNAAPVADAGESTVLSPCTENNFELDGYGSYDPEGAPLTFAWSILSAPTGSTAELDDPTVPNPIFRWDVIGTYTFELRVNDGNSESPPDIVSFTFTDESANNPPIANAGTDQTISATTECDTASYVFTCEDCPAESVELDGSASDDPLDGDEVDFLWTDTSGELTLSSRYAPVTEALTPSFASTYNVATTKSWEVVLTLSDCADSDTDSVNITYTCTGEYSP